MNDLERAIKNLNLGRYYEMLNRDEFSIEYDEWIYMLEMNGVRYVGNLQVPRYDKHTDTRVPDKYKYWFSGTSSQFKILYIYEYTHNHNLYNQRIFNVIKKDIVNALYNNFNVQQLPDEYDIKEMFGKHISNWQRNIRHSLKNYKIHDCRNDLCDILNEIDKNPIRWGNLLVMYNRFSYISLDENDVKIRDYIGFNDWSIEKQCLFIHMKDWLTMITINTLNNKKSDNVEFYKIKLKNCTFFNDNMFNDIKKNFFDNRNVIRILLSLMYLSSSDKQVMTTYKKFSNWIDATYIPYFNKYMINK